VRRSMTAWSGHHVFALFLLFCLSSTHAVAQNAIETTAEKSGRGYVVAFGLSDEQRVFHSEATRGAAVLARYYGRGVAPVVHTNTRKVRAATAASVRSAIASVAARMDREKDVLFVFLTSHGSEKGLAVKAGRHRSTLTPSILAQAVKQTEVRNRVLIISACFSGIFAQLADATTLVITAADARHPSFGCEDTATWTYFGQALFEQAIPQSGNLRDAFITARSLVLARELKEGFEPSNPQMSGGQNLPASLLANR
jgi:peptidase C13-like protein